MYIESIELDNVGPIEHLKVNFPFTAEHKPIPIILVGKNGSGKSIILSHIASALIAAHGTVYENSDVKSGKVYKLRSPVYISHTKIIQAPRSYSLGGIEQSEIQLDRSKRDFINDLEFSPLYKLWNNINDDQFSHYHSNFIEKSDQLKKIFESGPFLYFPPNRFEEPAWLNEINLENKVDYLNLMRLEGKSDRRIIIYSPMRENQSWLLDTIYDSCTTELKLIKNIVLVDFGFKELYEVRNEGPANRIVSEVGNFLLTMLKGDPPLRWIVGGRGRRSIGLTGNGRVLTNNLFSLSTGQSVILDIFLTIIRDADLSSTNYLSTSEICGIVVIDEIDLHLHTELQIEILPNLIKLFPKIQFIITTHSPLFLMGMQKSIGDNGFSIINLPNGEIIDVERFSEFETAFNYFTKTSSFESKIDSAVRSTHKPILFVEGVTDIKYIQAAANSLNHIDLISQFKVIDLEGSPNLDSLWKHYTSKLFQLIPQKSVFLYDCDVKTGSEQKGTAHKRVLPHHPHKIKKGIENMFPDEIIERAMAENPKFVDICNPIVKVKRGIEHTYPMTWEVNSEEKVRLCNWIVENADCRDFRHFEKFFQDLRGILDG